ncbi:MAG: phenylacetate--CoA ligase family protein, partial [Paludibacteraceae bacterium]
MDIEFGAIERIRTYQEDLLRKQIAYLAEHSPFYQRLFAKHAINPASIRTIEDLQHVPFTEKSDLQRFNDDFLCVP